MNLTLQQPSDPRYGGSESGGDIRGQGCCRPKGPENQYWLKEESSKSRGIRIETKGVDSIDVLPNVAREDEDEKDCGCNPYLLSIAPEQDECEAKEDLHHS